MSEVRSERALLHFYLRVQKNRVQVRLHSSY